MASQTSDPARCRVVVTGWGMVTPLGLDLASSWAALRAGRSGIGPITQIEAGDLPVQIAGEVKGFEPGRYLTHKVARRTDSYARYALVAAREALEHAKLTIDQDHAHRVGVLVGSGYGPMKAIAEHVRDLDAKGPRAVSPLAAVTGAIDSASGEISLATGAMGPSRASSSACASGTDAIGEAARWIRTGVSDVVIAGGADDIITRVDLASSGNAKALTTRGGDPTEASRPFDEDRAGFVMAAGSGMAVLESEEHALARGARILAEVVGYAATSDAYHWTAPHPEGTAVRRAIRGALADAGLTPEDVDHVNAHGTGTQLNDKTELAALRAEFGERIEQIPVSSTKSMTGHMIGAAGAVEAIISGLVINDGVVPPTINCHRPIDPSVNFVAHTAQPHQVDVVMSNSFGFGGHNAVLLLRRWRP
ncbi:MULTISPECIES: beta-ketoacyl-ACP synthase II [Streptomyces]|uniref:3-oxoacyl-[acyl-carrier-protein] synthase 2 n=2 Tax=Streptomyces TaxID=1883 RepID=A0A3M8EYE1_9ACTN|nr:MULTISPECIES: beta-ketoacyl-ACP synthase II [Streptomyces]KNE81934.1 3-oxoacyl-ACP synthase [Streptomyces fradiae]OFA51557.1 beta-ketoacyl-[acyl-carrier-protein] synthase II [Streptomyces fradiae]PQM20735.1 beta-ketoacyl-[acyl-carrier-protein] synthase II [Streptomyces xinghaiensis]RKM95946.1 beta-ketoacyl-[acyl-carrier-protein] synthase II [Streptomyces xinghaiensis]RNC70927.1 beta-ketoacyl-[acyl-carrier-protein] synthase II [Streptomyces xinghaiensis]